MHATECYLSLFFVPNSGMSFLNMSHVSHVLRCESQNLCIAEVIKQSAGDTLAITMDHMMKHEKTRAKDSSREHCG